MTDSELLEAALTLLVDFELDMPCDALTDIDSIFCYENCKYSCPTKECWRQYLEYRAKEG